MSQSNVSVSVTNKRNNHTDIYNNVMSLIFFEGRTTVTYQQEINENIGEFIQHVPTDYFTIEITPTP